MSPKNPPGVPKNQSVRFSSVCLSATTAEQEEEEDDETNMPPYEALPGF